MCWFWQLYYSFIENLCWDGEIGSLLLRRGSTLNLNVFKGRGFLTKYILGIKSLAPVLTLTQFCNGIKTSVQSRKRPGLIANILYIINVNSITVLMYLFSYCIFLINTLAVAAHFGHLFFLSKLFTSKWYFARDLNLIENEKW